MQQQRDASTSIVSNMLGYCLQDKLVRTVVANYVLWPAAHFINFKFVPGEHRILYNNCVSVSMPTCIWHPNLAYFSGQDAVIHARCLFVFVGCVDCFPFHYVSW